MDSTTIFTRSDNAGSFRTRREARDRLSALALQLAGLIRDAGTLAPTMPADALADILRILEQAVRDIRQVMR